MLQNGENMGKKEVKPTVSENLPLIKVSRNKNEQLTERKNVSDGFELKISDDVTNQSNDLALEIYEPAEDEISSSDSDDFDSATARTSHIFTQAVPEPLSNRSHRKKDKHAMEMENYGALLPFEDEFEDLPDLPSDEETAIMKEIRAEITEQVQSEMKSELAVYQNARKKLESPSASNIPEPDDKENLTGLEPKVQEAMIKMRKLDRILAKRVRREKEVKRDRIMLQRRLKTELENLKPEGREETKEIKTNTNKFLALTLPSSHSTGVLIDDPDNPNAPITPVFPTQVLEEHNQSRANSKSTEQGNKLGSVSTSNISESSQRTQSVSSASGRKSGKDFIKRNIQLASDANETIAMTDDEKQRLEDLLKDIEEMPELIIEPDALISFTKNGEGFIPETLDKQRLTHIEGRLKEILPAEDYESICTSPTIDTSARSALFTNTTILSTIEVDQLGEQILKEPKLQREQQNRLSQIEQELKHLSTSVSYQTESPCLANEQLHELLEQCSRAMVHTNDGESTTENLTSRSSATPLAILLENPPELPQDVLQQLLSDAQASNDILYKQNSNLTEHDLLLESITEEDMISARAAERNLSRLSNRSNSPFNEVQNQKLFAKTQNRRFLPEIDPTGRMSTQKLNYDINLGCSDPIRSTYPSRPSTVNSLTQHDGYSSPIPHPPSDKRS